MGTQTSSGRSAEKPDDRPSTVEQENEQERIRESGVGAELLRQIYVERLRSYMDGFYAHGRFADIVAVCLALELAEEPSADYRVHQAPVIESFVEMLGLKRALG